MPFDYVEIFLVGMRQRAQQFHKVIAGESFGLHRDNLTDRFAASLYDERLVSIADPIHDFGESPSRVGG
jgi:hypothetical protein